MAGLRSFSYRRILCLSSNDTFVEKHFVDRAFRRKVITIFLSFPRRRKWMPTLMLLDLLGLLKPANLSIDRIYYILAVRKENHSFQRSFSRCPKPRSYPQPHLVAVLSVVLALTLSYVLAFSRIPSVR